MPFKPAEFRMLSPQESRRLKRQLELYLMDYPAASAEDLAEIWHDDQKILAADTWMDPYLAGDDWRREVPRALLALQRAADYKATQRSFRAQAKERHLDRTPATERQLAALAKAFERWPDLAPTQPEPPSKLAASRLLDAARERRLSGQG